MSTALREIFASFGVEIDTTKLEEGNKKIDGTLGKIRELGTAVLEAFGVEQIIAFTEASAEQAVAVAHAAEATGLSTRELQAWQLGAAEAGVEGDEFTMALRRLSTSMAGGADSAGSQAKVFAELGIKTKDAAGNIRGLADILPEIAEHFKNMADGPKKAAQATELFGRQGGRLIPLLNQGSAGVQQMKADFDDLGGGFSPEFIKNAEENEKQSAKLKVTWDSLKSKAEGPLLIALNWVSDGLLKLAKGAGKLVEGTNIATSAMVVFGTIATAQLAKVAIANAPLLIEWGLIALAIGLVILAVDELITTWQGGDTLITRAIDKIWGPGSTAKAVASIKEIGNGLHEMFLTASNDADNYNYTWGRALDDIRGNTEGFGGYWRGFLAAAEDPFYALILALTSGWEGFGNFMAGMVEGLGFSFSVVWDDIKYAGLGVAAALSDAFDAFLSHLGPIKALAAKLGIDLSGSGGHAAADIGGHAGAGTGGHARADIDKDRAANTAARVTQGEDILAKIQGTGKYAPKSSRSAEYGPPRPPDVTVNSVTTVNVPAGTPGHVANQVGRAAAHGATGAHRKAAAALAKGA
jgi:hypothetical protein